MSIFLFLAGQAATSDGSPKLEGILQNLKVMLDKLNTARVMNRDIMNALLEIIGSTIHVIFDLRKRESLILAKEKELGIPQGKK